METTPGLNQLKNKTEGEMILARRPALESMKDQGIVSKHQVMDNKISTV